MPPDHQDEEPEILARIRRGERTDHYETVRQRKDGSLVDISLTVSPIKDGEGRIAGASKIARDITERKQSDRALRRSEEFTRRVLQSSQDCIKVLGLQGGLVTSNDCGLGIQGVRDIAEVTRGSYID